MVKQILSGTDHGQFVEDIAQYIQGTDLKTMSDIVTALEGTSSDTDSGNGTTTDGFADTLGEVNYENDRRFTVVLENTGGSNSLDYRFTILAIHGGSLESHEDTGTLAPGEVYRASLNYISAGGIKLYVKATSAGNQTTYSYEYVMSP